jgi:long-subunit acyl-CoA synthetase (AMP-forming)
VRIADDGAILIKGPNIFNGYYRDANATLERSESMRAELQTAIDEVNSRYAPVEQIKRFEIMPEDLSQPTGELTPTLKVKRSIVQQKYAETIDAIYRSPSNQIASQPPR